MPEIGTSGLMSGDGKRGDGQRPQATAPIRDLLLSISGVGDTLAGIVLAELPGPNVLHSSGEVVAYAGLNPRQHQSGTSVDRHVSPRLATLFFALHYTCRPYPPCGTIPQLWR